MFSFLILVMFNLISVVYSFIKDITNNNYKNVWKLTAKIIWVVNLALNDEVVNLALNDEVVNFETSVRKFTMWVYVNKRTLNSAKIFRILDIILNIK